MRLLPGILLCLLMVFVQARLGLAQAQPQPFAAFDRASLPVLNDPHDLTIGPDGRLYVADKFGDRVVVMDPKTLEILGSFGDGQLFGAHDISFGPDGRAYVAATGINAVVIFEFDAAGQATVVGSIPGMMRTEGVLAHSGGRVFVMASGTGELLAFENGTPVAGIGGLFGAHDLLEAHDGTIWVADNNRGRLVHLSVGLDLLGVLDDPALGLIGPRYLAMDDFGRLVVADQDAHRILLINPETGQLLGGLGDGIPGLGPNKFDDPEGAAVLGGVYYFADSDNNRIVRYVVLIN